MTEKDRIYKFLNPKGNELSVDIHPLAPRLESLDGKTIHLSITGEPDITIPLEKQLRADYPNVNWTMKKSYMPSPLMMTDEEMNTTDAVILGVCW